MDTMRNSAPSPRDPARRAALLRAVGAAGAAGAAATLGWPSARAGGSGPAATGRAPGPVVRLDQALPRILAGCGLPAASLGLCVAPVDGGPALAVLNAEQPFVMASTAKIVTSLAALELLGPRWRWRTQAYGTGPVHDGQLLGDLLIVGGGDPRLTSAELRDWLARLRAQGVTAVRGDLVIDRSAFHLEERDHAGTPLPAPERPHHARPDALVLDAGVPKAPPTQTVGQLWREAGGRLWGRLREGDLSAGRADHTRLPLLGRDGEALFPLSTHLSPPLPEVVHEINKTSHNLAARHLMLSLARGFPVQAATLPRARERVHDWLRRRGLAAGDIELDNGSGLSRAERGRPRALVQLLRHAWTTDDARHFIDSLPVAGVDGTLAHRLQRGAAEGQAWLKTGTLLDARALAGYVRGRSGRLHAVALFVNHPQAAQATPALDAVIETLARQG